MKHLLRLPLGGLCAVGLVVLHVVHLCIHHTPLDSGSLDATVMYLTVLFESNINTR